MVIPVRAGVLAGGQELARREAVCHLIRVAVVGCPSCASDAGELSRLLSLTRGRGCQALLIPPTPSSAPVRAAAGRGRFRFLEYVDYPLGSRLNVFLTPQTFLTDSLGRVVWLRQGAVSPGSLKSAERSLARLPACPLQRGR